MGARMRFIVFYSTPFVFLTGTFTGKFLCGRYPSHNYLLKSLRVAIATNHISLNFPHKDGSLRKRWYLSIPQLVLIIFGLGIVFNNLCISYGRIHGRVSMRWRGQKGSAPISKSKVFISPKLLINSLKVFPTGGVKGFLNAFFTSTREKNLSFSCE